MNTDKNIAFFTHAHLASTDVNLLFGEHSELQINSLNMHNVW